MRNIEQPIPAPETVVGASLKVDGDLKSQGDIRIEGKVHGSIQTDGTVVIGPSAEITASIQAANAEISGRVEGDITVKERLSLTNSAKVKGNLISQELVIQQGAVFSGNSSMPDKSEVTPIIDTNISINEKANV